MTTTSSFCLYKLALLGLLPASTEHQAWSALVDGSCCVFLDRSVIRGAAMVGPRRPLFVLFGSSIVQYSFGNGGWGATLAEIYARKADIILRGYSGWNSRRALQVVDKIFPKDASIQPSLIIVYFGGNDSMGPHPSGLGPHVPLPEYIANMRKIAEHLMSLSDKSHKTRIIFLSCPPLNEEQFFSSLSDAVYPLDRTNESCRLYSEACIKLCQDLNLKFVDLWTAIQRRHDWKTACFIDGVHLTKEGSNIVVEEILGVLREADWEPSLHWRSLPAEFGEDSPCDIVTGDGRHTINLSDLNLHWEHQWD